MKEEEIENVKPFTKEAHLSTVFISTSTKKLSVAFSVPIWSESPDGGPRTVLGIFAMAAELKRLEFVRHAMLFDTRNDNIGKETRRQ